MKGHTSRAPILCSFEFQSIFSRNLGCSPVCFRMSILAKATFVKTEDNHQASGGDDEDDVGDKNISIFTFAAARAASTTLVGSPTKVNTVRFVD